MNCKNCGRIVAADKLYCSSECETAFSTLMNSTEKPVFKNYQQAGRHFQKDFRTIKKFEGELFTIDRTKPASHVQWIPCRVCNEFTYKSHARHGYCKKCTDAGLGKANQGKLISERYRGQGNPNYLDGTSKSLEYQENHWYRLKKELNFTRCALSGLESDIDYHHILPRWFCKLSNIDVYDPNNIIGLNRSYHIAVHHLQLDVLLLPTLYSLYKKDALQLREEFVKQLQLHKVHQFPVDQLQSLSLFQVSRYPGKKKLLGLIPEFLTPFLNRQESLSASQE